VRGGLSSTSVSASRVWASLDKNTGCISVASTTLQQGVVTLCFVSNALSMSNSAPSEDAVAQYMSYSVTALRDCVSGMDAF
jgi:hypothetical protein